MDLTTFRATVLLHHELERLDQRDAGIMLSGGLDSAIMLAMAVSWGQRRWQVRTIHKADGSEMHASRILAWINQRWNVDLHGLPAGDASLHHTRQLASALSQVRQELPGVTWFSAENRVPDDLPGGPVRRRSLDPATRQPWFDLTKDEIVAAGLAQGLHGLIELAHSCTERQEGRCGLCWQCQERAWAFAQLGVADPGCG